MDDGLDRGAAPELGDETAPERAGLTLHARRGADGATHVWTSVARRLTLH
jgi:hypothetical protein